MIAVALFLFIVAAALFLAASFPTVIRVTDRINLIALGLCLATAAYIVQYTVTGHLIR